MQPVIYSLKNIDHNSSGKMIYLWKHFIVRYFCFTHLICVLLNAASASAGKQYDRVAESRLEAVEEEDVVTGSRKPPTCE